MLENKKLKKFSFNFDYKVLCNKDKAIEAVLYIVNKQEIISSFYLNKILYFAEKYNMEYTGNMIYYLQYIHNLNGVEVLKLEQLVRHAYKSLELETTLHKDCFFIKTRKEYKQIYLSFAELKSIDSAYEYCLPLNYGQLIKETTIEGLNYIAPEHYDLSYRDFIFIE